MLRLRPYKECDAEHIVKWIKDEYTFRRWCADKFESYPITAEDLKNHYREKYDNDGFYQMTAFDETGVAGHLIMRFLDKDKKILRFGFVIIDDEKRGKGYGKELVVLALKYAFDILKVEKVTLGVFDNNPNAIQCYKSVGFKETGKLEQYQLIDQSWKCIDMEYSPSV